MFDNGAAYVEKLEFQPKYRSLATLADDQAGLTCSVTAGRRWAADGRAGSVVGYPRFELAAERVREGEHDVLLVPSAYPDINDFFFDPMLQAEETFLSTLPDIVFAIPQYNDGPDVDTLFLHPATKSLVGSLPNKVRQVELSTSNSAACRAALDYRGAGGAITNDTSATHYGLRKIRVLAAGTRMGFVVFTRKAGAS